MEGQILPDLPTRQPSKFPSPQRWKSKEHCVLSQQSVFTPMHI